MTPPTPDASHRPTSPEVAHLSELVHGALETLRKQDALAGVQIEIVEVLPDLPVDAGLQPALCRLLREAVRSARALPDHRLSLHAFRHSGLGRIEIRHEPADPDGPAGAPEASEERQEERLESLEEVREMIARLGGHVTHRVHPGSPPTYAIDVPLLGPASRARSA